MTQEPKKKRGPPPFHRPPAWKRKYLVNPRFQIGFTLVFVSLFLVSMSVLYWGISGVLKSFSAIPEGASEIEKQLITETLVEQQTLITQAFAASAGWILCLMFIAGILISHRVAGPMHRLKNHFDSLKEANELKEVEFREGDYFIEVTDSFNQLVQTVNSKKN